MIRTYTLEDYTLVCVWSGKLFFPLFGLKAVSNTVRNFTIVEREIDNGSYIRKWDSGHSTKGTYEFCHLDYEQIPKRDFLLM